MDRVTAEQVRDAIAERQITEWPLRACARCGEPVAYVFRNDLVFFDSACGCALKPVQLRTWREVADTLNMQTPESRARIWREMLHLPVEETSRPPHPPPSEPADARARRRPLPRRG